MIILPAVDLIGGVPVRLYQGDYSKKEVVAESALQTAEKFEACGAEYVHLVDLDGAKSGQSENRDIIAGIANRLHIPVEAGGGIRTMDQIEWYLSHGVQRVILGTAAVENEELLKEAVRRYGEHIAVGMDCRDGYVCVSGWLEKSNAKYLSFAKYLEETGVQNIIFTDISTDGTLQGPNFAMLEKLKSAVNVKITASGGVHNMEDIRRLSALGLYGAIVGKAVYTGDVDLAEAVRAGKGTL